jgi:exonuclease III
LAERVHICCILETRTTDFGVLLSLLPEYKVLHNDPSHPHTKGKGVALFIHASLWDHVTILFTLSGPFESVCVRLPAAFFGLHMGEVALAVVYVRPQSTHQTPACLEDCFNVQDERLRMLLTQCKQVFVCGDFNARIGQEPEYLSRDDRPARYFPWLLRPRCLHGPKTQNVAGQCLQKVVVQNSLLFTTGRGKGDEGQSTSGFASATDFNGARVDHVLVMPSVYGAIQQIEIDRSVPISDHAPITVSFATAQHSPDL